MRLLCVLALLALSTLVSAQDCTSAACQAYVWASPLWRWAQTRFMTAAAAQIGGQPTPLNSLVFKNNGTINGLPQFSRCDAWICAGATNPNNPAPVTSPNFDTIYGYMAWDLGDVSAGPSGVFHLSLPPFATYWNLIFYDMYTNIVTQINSVDNASPGVQNFCFSQGPSWTCQDPGFTNLITLPRFGVAIFRTFSNGQPAPCGVHGCTWILQVRQSLKFERNGTNLINIFQKYAPSMGPNCPYAYGPGQIVPCGNGDKTYFWNAVCTAIAENPVTGAEATYVEDNFGALGIYPTGCVSPQYALLNPAVAEGWNYVDLASKTTSVRSGDWYFVDFSGNWGSNYLSRAAVSYRGGVAISNQLGVYWGINVDSNGDTLDASWGQTYKITFQSNDIITTQGFWSVTHYDPGFFFYRPSNDLKQYGVRGWPASPSDPTGNPTNGLSFPISNTCVSSACIRVPPGPFTLVFRIYESTNVVLPGGGYVFPKVEPCPCGAPCL